MKIGLIGFGKTGRAVAGVLLKSSSVQLRWVYRKSEILDHRSVPEFLGIESNEPGLIYSKLNASIEALLDNDPVDIIVDFSSVEGIYDYGQLAADRGISIISAISNYGETEKELLRELAILTTVFWSPNITLGINYLIIALKLLRIIAPNLDFEVIEEHHKTKPEVSGTAKKLASAVGVADEQIHSVRVGGVIGRHEVVAGFPAQTIRFIHESISREAFGNGVLFVIENLEPKSVGFYDFESLLRPYLDLKKLYHSVQSVTWV